MKVSVVYALPTEQRVFELTVDEGSTVRQVIETSPVLDYYPEIDIGKVKTGVFSDLVPLTRVVKNNERVEIYRPLIADPKELRRRRADKAVEEGRANQKTGGRVTK